jgi:hypothetical protein
MLHKQGPGVKVFKERPGSIRKIVIKWNEQMNYIQCWTWSQAMVPSIGKFETHISIWFTMTTFEHA